MWFHRAFWFVSTFFFFLYNTCSCSTFIVSSTSFFFFLFPLVNQCLPSTFSYKPFKLFSFDIVPCFFIFLIYQLLFCLQIHSCLIFSCLLDFVIILLIFLFKFFFWIFFALFNFTLYFFLIPYLMFIFFLCFLFALVIFSSWICFCKFHDLTLNWLTIEIFNWTQVFNFIDCEFRILTQV